MLLWRLTTWSFLKVVSGVGGAWINLRLIMLNADADGIDCSDDDDDDDDDDDLTCFGKGFEGDEKKNNMGKSHHKLPHLC